jgi:hypothetical protein
LWWWYGRYGRVPLAPFADQHVPIHERQEQRRAGRDPAPLDDPAVEVRDDVADVLLAGQLLDRRGQLFDLLAQQQRGGQHLVGRHALAAQVVPQPGLGGVLVGPLGQRLTRARQVIEGPPLLGLADLPVDPRGEAEVRWFAFGHG